MRGRQKSQNFRVRFSGVQALIHIPIQFRAGYEYGKVTMPREGEIHLTVSEDPSHGCLTRTGNCAKVVTIPKSIVKIIPALERGTTPLLLIGREGHTFKLALPTMVG